MTSSLDPYKYAPPSEIDDISEGDYDSPAAIRRQAEADAYAFAMAANKPYDDVVKDFLRRADERIEREQAKQRLERDAVTD